MIERGKRRQTHEIAPFDRAAQLFEGQRTWENAEFNENELPSKEVEDVLDNSAVYSYLQSNNVGKHL
jgi:hypothetical protein